MRRRRVGSYTRRLATPTPTREGRRERVSKTPRELEHEHGSVETETRPGRPTPTGRADLRPARSALVVHWRALLQRQRCLLTVCELTWPLAVGLGFQCRRAPIFGACVHSLYICTRDGVRCTEIVDFLLVYFTLNYLGVLVPL